MYVQNKILARLCRFNHGDSKDYLHRYSKDLHGYTNSVAMIDRHYLCLYLQTEFTCNQHYGAGHISADDWYLARACIGSNNLITYML